jgi:hypothetical protein
MTSVPSERKTRSSPTATCFDSATVQTLLMNEAGACVEAVSRGGAIARGVSLAGASTLQPTVKLATAIARSTRVNMGDKTRTRALFTYIARAIEYRTPMSHWLLQPDCRKLDFSKIVERGRDRIFDQQIVSGLTSIVARQS